VNFGESTYKPNKGYETFSINVDLLIVHFQGLYIPGIMLALS
jgi:hypothetical protein